MIDLAVSAVVLEQGQVLLIEREDLQVWALPGGQVEVGESIARAAIREAQEETGIEIELVRMVGIYSRPEWFGGNHSVVFAGRAVGGALVPQQGETLQARFFGLDELPELLLWWHRQMIRDALEGYGNSLVCTQKVTWPQEEIKTKAEYYELNRQGKMPIELIQKAFCREIEEGDQQSEIGG
jgi:8-oxo-dGTP diphosphatase